MRFLFFLRIKVNMRWKRLWIWF